ncbi:MAG: EAL domain-containing protein [Alphaproteobacteria bacterium]|nr:EAL domain-containing protein [Alphaproteobacteria bacterium]
MGEKETTGDSVRQERDRFVAFAFSAADAFVELDDKQSVRYATGAVKSLTGMNEKKLLGKNFLDLVLLEDRPIIVDGCELAAKQGRCGPLRLRLKHRSGRPIHLELRGTYLPINGGGLFLSLNRGLAGHAGAAKLMDKEGFADTAHEAIKAAREGDRPAVMTMLDLEGLSEVMGRIDETDAANLMSDINAYIQTRAIGGEMAGEFGDDKFGVVHDPAMDVPHLGQTIIDRVLLADPEGEGIKVHTASIDLSDEALSDFDDAKALLYTINKFSDERGKFTIDDLQTGYKSMLDVTRKKILTFKNIVANGDFLAFYQPIVELSTRNVDHYEALARLGGGGVEDSPFELITFAEDAGIIMDFDLAMCGRVMRFLEKIKQQQRELRIAVNLSGRSLESPVFLDKLIQLLGHFSPPRDWLQFEITESSTIQDLEATNKFLQALRKLGHEVCLDDFGSGASAFQYLNALEVDGVKIDGVYVREAQDSDKGKAFLRSIAALCKDLGIDTVGEMVEVEASADFLHGIGVRYGQGYLFGKPTKDISGWRPDEKKSVAVAG